MAEICIKKGLNIPIKGAPQGEPKDFVPSGVASALKKPKTIALNLEPFEGVRFRLLAKVGDTVKIGQPLVEDKQTEGRVFASPAAGVIKEVRRGLKRRLIDIVIEVADNEESINYPVINPESTSKDELIDALLKGGLFANIRCRPFDRLADPKKEPRSIFIKAIESAPFTPPAEMQVAGHEKHFNTGLAALKKLTSGPVHLIYSKESTLSAFTEAKDVQRHTAAGPHPVANSSIHINYLDPIKKPEDVVWTLTALDVVRIGHLLNTGKVMIEHIVSIAGPALIENRSGYFKLRQGFPIAPLISGRVKDEKIRIVSGDPLMGKEVDTSDYLQFYHTQITCIQEPDSREFLHFFRLGSDKYSYSRAYLSGHVKHPKPYSFTTSKHGEHRAFIDSALYKDVQPLNIPTMNLVKAVMAEDYDLAEELGLLEVAPEDFALPTFVCPSKMEMTEIIKQGLQAHAKEVLE